MPLGKILVDFVQKADVLEITIFTSCVFGFVLFIAIFWYIFESTKEEVIPVQQAVDKEKNEMDYSESS